MIVHLYCLKNRLSGLYQSPYVERYSSDEMLEVLKQSLAYASLSELTRSKENDLYYLGDFDTKSAEIVNTKIEFVCSLEQICLDYISRKKVEQDGEN